MQEEYCYRLSIWTITTQSAYTSRTLYKIKYRNNTVWLKNIQNCTREGRKTRKNKLKEILYTLNRYIRHNYYASKKQKKNNNITLIVNGLQAVVVTCMIYTRAGGGWCRHSKHTRIHTHARTRAHRREAQTFRYSRYMYSSNGSVQTRRSTGCFTICRFEWVCVCVFFLWFAWVMWIMEGGSHADMK